MIVLIKGKSFFERKGALVMTCKFLTSFMAVLLIASSASRAADDGATLYKTKCAGCHGPNGEGKAAVKSPALKGTTLNTNQVAEQITKGEAGRKAPHNKGISGLNDEQAKAIAEFVKSLK
jgi:mono/diheme cytochrome c family protein